MRHVQFTLDEVDHDKLDALAKHRRQSKADLLRTLIDRKWQAIFGPKKEAAGEPAR